MTNSTPLLIEFDEEKHVYRVGGKKVPAVSDILKSIGISKDFTMVDPFYRDRGIAVHKAIEFYLEGDLDESQLDSVCVPYIDGFKKWWGERPYNMGLSKELRLYSQKYNFAGTLDLVLWDDGKIVDYKCSKSPDPASELQGVLYQQLVLENYQKVLPFSVLQLPGDGLFMEIKHLEPQSDLLEAIMRLYNWKKGNVPKLSVVK